MRFVTICVEFCDPLHEVLLVVACVQFQLFDFFDEYWALRTGRTVGASPIFDGRVIASYAISAFVCLFIFFGGTFGGFMIFTAVKTG